MPSITNEDYQIIKTQDKRQVAIHEAGHVVVAAVYGSSVRAWIWEHETDSPFENRTYLGTTSCDTGGGSRAVIGVAGFVAECLEEGTDSNEIAHLLDDAVFYGELSATDVELIESGNLSDAVDDAVRILTEYR